MKKFSKFIIKFRLIIILVTIGITIFFGYHLKDIEVNSDILSYLPDTDESVKLFNEIGDKFSGNSLAVIAIENKNIFNYETLNRIKKLTSAIKSDSGISQVISLTNIIDIKKAEDGLEISNLINTDDIPKNEETLEKLKLYILSKDMYTGNLISSNGKVTVIICKLKDDVDKVVIGRRLKKIVEEYPGHDRIYYAGIPFQMVSIHEIIVSQVKKLVPLVIILIIIILFLSFKNYMGVILPLSTGLLSTIWIFGLMNIAGNRIDLVSSAIPVLLIAIGTAYGIHVITKYFENANDETIKNEKIQLALEKVGIPVILAAVTTAIGFLSFLTAYITPIKYFGIFMSLGILFALVISLMFVPSVLSFCKMKKSNTKDKHINNKWLIQFMDNLSDFVLKNGKSIVFSTIIIALICIISLFHIKRSVNIMEYFDKNDEIRVTERMMQKNFGGSIPIQILVKGDIQNPHILKEMLKIENYLKTLPYVNDPRSFADIICEMNNVMNGRYIIPDTREGVSNLWLLLEGQDVLSQMVDENNTNAIIQAKLGTIDTEKIIQLVDEINDFIKNNVDNEFIEVSIRNVGASEIEIINEKKNLNIINNIKIDILSKSPNFKININDFKDILLYETVKNYDLEQSSISTINKKMKNYFSSDEADIEVINQRRIDKINFKIIENLQQGSISKEDIINILNRNVSKNLLNDEEGIEIASESIELIINNVIKKEKIEIIFAKMKGLFPENLQNNKKFEKRIKDILWEINEEYIVLSPDEYTSIFQENSKSIEKLSVEQTGLPVIYKELDRQIVISQLQSLIISLFIISMLLMIGLRSLTGGIIGIIPIILTVLINFGIMAVMGIALDVITVLIGSVAIGIGIDYSIHFISRFKLEMKQNSSIQNALKKTLETTGIAILINALSVSTGFLVLLFGNIAPIRQFGWLMAVTMIVSAFGAIVVLPAVIIVTHTGFIGNLKQFTKVTIRKKIKRK